MFVDRAVINVYAGTGGSGSEAMRREKGVPRGGPAGGDGGKGGDVILVGDAQLTTLLDVTLKQHYKAEPGKHGGGKNMTGRSGVDLEIRIPAGTVLKDADTDEILGEILEAGQRLVIARGGRGGRGNTHFTSARHQSPRRWEPGGEGEELRLALELKLIADVGLVGEPNAGKSTFLAAVSQARPRVADYPFTTLTPNLGVVSLPDFRSFVLADIPGIIEGAHEGKGLGFQFLRHIERTRTLAYFVPVTSPDPQAEYHLLREELANHSETLGARTHCVVLTKTDLLGDDDLPTIDAPDAWGVFSVSAVTRQDLPALVESLWKQVDQVRMEEIKTDAQDAADEDPWK